MRAAVIPIGDGAEAYIDTALALYKQGKRGRFLVDNLALLLLDTKSLKIIMLASRYALFQQDPATGRFFSWFGDTVPAELPTFDHLLLGLPTFYPAYPGEEVSPAYDRFKFYEDGAGAAYQELPFAAPILSAYGEYLQWRGVLVQPNSETGNCWFLTRYILGGYLNAYVNPDRSKVVLSDGGTNNLGEADFTALNVFPAAGFAREGVAYRRLKDAAAGDTIVLCQQDDTLYSGQIYKIAEADGTLSTEPFGLPDLPAGARLSGGEHVDWMYDIFTSERAKHYYVVKLCVDTSIAYFGFGSTFPYGNDVKLFPGMSLTVEKRLKTDLSLVATYNLTPTEIDRTNQGVAPLAQAYNTANGQQSGASTGTDIITRFAPYGTGYVLVDEAGIEYPILPVLACSQDYFWSDTLAYSARGVLLAGGLEFDPATYGFKRNVYQQAALLWLGGTGGWTWGGVDAAGLSATAAQPGLANDVNIGGMRTFGSIIGDSDHVLAQLLPFAGGDPGQSNTQRIISVAVAGGVPVVRLEQVQNSSQGFYSFDI